MKKCIVALLLLGSVSTLFGQLQGEVFISMNQGSVPLVYPHLEFVGKTDLHDAYQPGAGFALRYPINSRISLSSGLEYVQLMSGFSDGPLFPTSGSAIAESKWFFIRQPIQMAYRFVNRRLKMDVEGGLNIGLGLQSKFTYFSLNGIDGQETYFSIKEIDYRYFDLGMQMGLRIEYGVGKRDVHYVVFSFSKIFGLTDLDKLDDSQYFPHHNSLKIGFGTRALFKKKYQG